MQGRAAFVPAFLTFICAAVFLSGAVDPSRSQSPRAASSFDVEITLSQRAVARLNTLSEGIVVAARYYGDPAPGAESHVNQVGQIDLGRETVEVSGRPQIVHIAGPDLTHKLLAQIQGPVMLNINLYSARRKGPDNILDCDFFDGNLQDAVHKPLVLHCALISEGYVSGVVPIPAGRAADSYAIYSLLLPGAPLDRLAPSHIRRWTIAGTTVSITDMSPAVPPDGQLKAPPDNVKAFNEALEDFQVRKYDRFQLETASLHWNRSFNLLSNQQVSDLRRSGSSDTGIAFFSAVYFNNKQTAALVYVNDWCGNLCAAGQWVYLEKQNGQWVRRSGITTGGA